MASNDFLPFAVAGGANVVSQAVYAALAALGPGFQTGIAESNQLNKVWRQASIMAAVLGQMSADITGQNAVDDGTTATILGNLLTTMQTVSFATDTGSGANTYTLVYSPAAVVPLTDGAMYRFRPAHSNTGASTLAVNSSGGQPILTPYFNALQGGEIVLNGVVTVMWSAHDSSFIILGTTANTAKPGFHAHLSSNNTTLASGGTIVFNTVDEQTGTGYASGTGIFTCQVPGRYVVTSSFTTSNTSGSTQSAGISISSSRYGAISGASVNIPTGQPGGNSCSSTILMQVGDTLKMTTSWTASSTLPITGNAQTSFSAVLVG
jgi:hypothetical protein